MGQSREERTEKAERIYTGSGKGWDFKPAPGYTSGCYPVPGSDAAYTNPAPALVPEEFDDLPF